MAQSGATILAAFVAAQIDLQKGERSELAELAADIL